MINSNGLYFNDEFGTSFEELLLLIKRANVVEHFLDVEDGELTDEARERYETGSTVERKNLKPFMDYMQTGQSSNEWFGCSAPPPPPTIYGEEIDNDTFHSVIHLISDIHLDNNDGETGWFSSSSKGPYHLLTQAVEWLARDARSHYNRFNGVKPTMHIVGDWFDIWQACGPVNTTSLSTGDIPDYTAALQSVGNSSIQPLEAFKKYGDEFKIVYTVGNHDMEVIYHHLEAVVRDITGITNLEIGWGFVEPRLNMIGLHGHQADRYNAGKTIRGRWAPGEIIVRNGNRPWLQWEKGAYNLRMYTLSLSPVTDGVVALDDLLEYGHIRVRDAERLVRKMIETLTLAEIIGSSDSNKLYLILDAVVAAIPTSLANAISSLVYTFSDLEIRTLIHLTTGQSQLEVDGDTTSDNSDPRELFQHLYENDSNGDPLSFNQRLVMSRPQQQELNRLARTMGATISTSGHTHVPELSGGDNHLYLNTGSWTDRWQLRAAKVFGMRRIVPAYPVSTISRIYKIYIGKGVHDIVVELYNFDGTPRLLCRRRMRVAYS